jgi:hypothetical protein
MNLRRVIDTSATYKRVMQQCVVIDFWKIQNFDIVILCIIWVDGLDGQSVSQSVSRLLRTN